MPLMQEAMGKEDWDRAEKGLPPIKKEVKKKPEPDLPEVKGMLFFEDIKIERFNRLLGAKMHSVPNKEGMRFIGYDVQIELAPTEKEKEPKVVKGWMPESEWLLLLGNARSKIDIRVVQF